MTGPGSEETATGVLQGSQFPVESGKIPGPKTRILPATPICSSYTCLSRQITAVG
jgi:hypothetical protein